VPRAEKEAKVKGLADRLTSSKAAVLAGYRGLTVHDTAELRASLAEVETRFSVVKNSLARLAAKEAGLDGLADLIDGPTAIAFVSGDPVAGAKRLVDQMRRLPVLEVRGGFAEGRILSADEVRALAALESREVMLAQLAGMATSGLGRTAWALRALQSRLVLLMNALKEKLPPEAAAEDHPDPDRPGTGGEEATRPEPTPPGEPEEAGETADQPAEPGPEEGGGRAEEPEGGT
jgi:large subunit ribosomal protein L10